MEGGVSLRGFFPEFHTPRVLPRPGWNQPSLLKSFAVLVARRSKRDQLARQSRGALARGAGSLVVKGTSAAPLSGWLLCTARLARSLPKATNQWTLISC